MAGFAATSIHSRTAASRVRSAVQTGAVFMITSELAAGKVELAIQVLDLSPPLTFPSSRWALLYCGFFSLLVLDT